MRKNILIRILFFFLITLIFFRIGHSVYAGICTSSPPYNCFYTDLGLECPEPGDDLYDPDLAHECCVIANGESACTVSLTEAAGCFLPGTFVKGESGIKKIEDIKVGDKVTSFKGGKIVESTVSNIYKRIRDFYYSLTAGDYKVKATSEHPFYVGNGEYKEISKLKKGDTIYVLEDDSLTPKKVTSNEKINEKTPVYNMSVDNTETFFANDFAVHNKSNCVERMGLFNWPTITRTSNTSVRIHIDANTTPYAPLQGPEFTLVLALETADPRTFRLTQECQGVYASQCILFEDHLDSLVDHTFNVTGLNQGTLYKLHMTYYPLGLVCGGKDYIYLSSCRMTPDPRSIPSIGSSRTLTTGLNLALGQQVAVLYQSQDPAVATVTNIINKALQWPLSFTTTATGVSIGSTTVTNRAYYNYGDGDEPNFRQVCSDTATVNVGSPTSTPTPTNTPTPTSTPASGPWVKLKSTSYYSNNNLINNIPLVPVAYDSDDNTNPYFIIGQPGAGLTAASSINLTTLNSNAKPNNSDWSATGYSAVYSMTPATFRSYVIGRKEYKTISALGSIDQDGIYLWNGANPLPINDTNKVRFDNYNVVLITSGTINFNTASFAPTNGSTAFIASSIGFSNITQEAEGIFIADSISTGTTANLGLKITGNLVAQSSFTNNRKWTNSNVPSVFIVFDQLKYLDLFPFLSTVNYEWNQTQ